jgi:hypothetical protein
MAVMAVPFTGISESTSPMEQSVSQPIVFKSSLLSRSLRAMDRVPAWRQAALFEISNLAAAGRSVAGFGDFRPSPIAVRKMQLALQKVDINSLPAPMFAPISGGGLMARWKSGARTVEVTVYDDGEIVRDAMLNGETNEDISECEIYVMLLWLSGRLVFDNASAR